MATKTPTRPVDSSDAQNSLDSVKVLSDCCERGVVCYFQLVHCEGPVRAKFVALRSKGIELRVSVEKNDLLILPQAICCISFSYRTVFCAFLGCLVEVKEPTSTGRQVMATIPEQLTTTNLRQSFRIPVIQGSGLETIIRTADNERFVAHTLDIAETGLELEFAEDNCPALSVGASLSVELRFRDEVVQRIGVVRRVDGVRCALSYKNATNVDDRRQASRMNGIVRSMQQVWLKNRIKSNQD